MRAISLCSPRRDAVFFALGLGLPSLGCAARAPAPRHPDALVSLVARAETSRRVVPTGTEELEVDAAPAAGLSRADFVAAYVAEHPSTAALASELALGRARVRLAATLENPELDVQVWNVPFDAPHRLDEAGMWMAFVRQSLGTRGARGARTEAARYRAEAEALEASQTVLEVGLEAAALHGALVALDAELASREAELATLRALAEVTRRQLPSGGADVADVADVEAEVALAETERDGLLARRRALGRLAASRLGRGADDVAVTPSETQVDAGRLRALLARHPTLHASRLRTAAAREEARAVRFESRRLRTTIGAGALVDAHDGAGLGLSAMFRLPWIGARARAEHSVAEAEADAMERESEVRGAVLERELEAALAEREAALGATQALEQSTLPALEARVAATMAGIASGRREVRDALEARARLAAARREHAVLGAELARLDANLAALEAFLVVESEGDAP